MLQLLALELPPLRRGDGGLGVVLACMPDEEGSLVSYLSLLPYAVLHNCTPLDLSILVRGKTLNTYCTFIRYEPITVNYQSIEY